MQLARRAEPELDVGIVSRPSLPAEPGKEELFGELYSSVLPVAMDHASRFLSDGEARDAVGDAFADIWVRWGKLTVEQRTRAFVLGAVHNQILNRLRENQRLVGLEDAESELTRLAIHEIDTPTRATTASDVLDEVIAAMPHRRREVYLLVRELRYSYKEVAALLSISEGTVNTHIRLASEAIRAALLHYGFRIVPGGTPQLAPGPAVTREETDV